MPTIILIVATTIIFDMVTFLQAVLGFYNGIKDTIEFQDYWSSAAMANVMQNILQMLNNTCHWIGPTAIADNANVVLLCQQHSCGLCEVTMGRTLLFASSSNIFDSNIFNLGRHKNKVGMKIPDWMITDEMKQTEHYRMYTEVFGINVPLTGSQPTESTHGTHRTTSAPRSPNPDKEVAESSAPRRSTVIRLCLPERRPIRLTQPAPVPTVDKADDMISQDTLQVSLAEHKSHEEQEARVNVAVVDEHLASEEIEKIVEEQENIIDDSSIPKNDESNILGTRIEPHSDKESPEVEIAKEKEVEITQEMEVEITQETPAVDITNVIIPVNVTDEDEEITDEVYELKRREKGNNVEDTRNSPIPTPIRSSRIHTNLVSSDTKKLQELTDTPHTTSSSSLPHKKLTKTNLLLSLFKTKPTRFNCYKSFFHELQGRYGYLFAHLWARFMPRKSFYILADNLHDVMVETLPTIVDKHVKKQVMQQVPEQVQNQVSVYVAEGLILERQKAKEETKRLIAKAILQERRNIQAQILTQIENAIANVIPSQVDASLILVYKLHYFDPTQVFYVEANLGNEYQRRTGKVNLETNFSKDFIGILDLMLLFPAPFIIFRDGNWRLDFFGDFVISRMASCHISTQCMIKCFRSLDGFDLGFDVSQHCTHWLL
ncbi:hypothetical protein Tco_1092362 [Tanacetum coccineum]|uniref:Uncharacterized protein n=1 Tax=Tanacetum coccineum TaxID=301880 RepID=A0ABQ5IAY0_9ASTR